MKYSFEHGKIYRAKVAVEPLFRAFFTSEDLKSILRQHKLFGQVTETDEGYQVEAEFRGKTGSYDLPEEVREVVFVR